MIAIHSSLVGNTGAGHALIVIALIGHHWLYLTLIAGCIVELGHQWERHLLSFMVAKLSV